MSELLRRIFISAGLYALAVPGLIAIGANHWETFGMGCLAGLVGGITRWGQ